jgi:1,4-dihydroxy-2-naphthoyl-CoA hydrolase
VDARDRKAEPADVSGSLPDSVAELAPQFAHAPGGTLMAKIGLEFLTVEPGRVVARIPVEGNTQPYGLLHGGATAALLETIGSFGSAMAAGPDRLVMGIELNVNHIRGVREGHVTATGVPLHVGRTTAVWDMRVHDDEGRLVAVGRLTLAIRETSTP